MARLRFFDDIVLHICVSIVLCRLTVLFGDCCVSSAIFSLRSLLLFYAFRLYFRSFFSIGTSLYFLITFESAKLLYVHVYWMYRDF